MLFWWNIHEGANIAWWFMTVRTNTMECEDIRTSPTTATDETIYFFIFAFDCFRW
jgi:hypothetical protein